MPIDPRDLADEEFCYLKTIGRISGRPHEIEIWFALEDEGYTLYMLSGARDRSDWVKKLRLNPEVTVRLTGEDFEGRARVVEDAKEEALARSLLVEKYERDPSSLANWGRTAVPVAVDLALA